MNGKTNIETTTIAFLEYDFISNQVHLSLNFEKQFALPDDLSDITHSAIVENIIKPEHHEDFLTFIAQLDQGIMPTTISVEVLDAAGSYIWVRLIGIPLFDVETNLHKGIIVFENIEDKVKLELEYRTNPEYLDHLTGDTMLYAQVNITTNTIEEIRTTFPELKNTANKKLTDVIKTISKKVVQEQREEFLRFFEFSTIFDDFNNKMYQKNIVFLIRRRYRDLCWYDASIYFVLDEGDIRCRIYVKNVDEKVKYEVSLKEQAQKDSLTKLYNYLAIERLVSKYLEISAKPSAFIMIDVDNFKFVNDTYGHFYGDKMLITIAAYLTKYSPSKSIVSRMGGDEFGIFIPDIASDDEAIEVANALCANISELSIEGQHLVSLSIGVAFTQNHEATFTQLYRNADKAQYVVKKNGKNKWALYDPSVVESETEEKKYQVIDTKISRTIEEFHRIIVDGLMNKHPNERTIYAILEFVAHSFGVDKIIYIDGFTKKKIFQWPETANLELGQSLDFIFNEKYNFYEDKEFSFTNCLAQEKEIKTFCKKHGVAAVYTVPVKYNNIVGGKLVFTYNHHISKYEKDQIDVFRLTGKIISVILERLCLHLEYYGASEQLKAILPNVLLAMPKNIVNQLDAIIALYKNYQHTMFAVYLEPGLPFDFTTPGIHNKLKYLSQEELLKELDNKFLNLVHPNDQFMVMQMLYHYDTNQEIKPFRVLTKAHDIIWIRCQVLDVITKNKRRTLILSYYDETDLITNQNILEEKIKLIESQNMELQLYQNLSSGGIFKAIVKGEKVELEYANDKFFEILQCTRDEFYQVYDASKGLSSELLGEYIQNKEMVEEAIRENVEYLTFQNVIKTFKGKEQIAYIRVYIAEVQQQLIIKGFITIEGLKTYIPNGNHLDTLYSQGNIGIFEYDLKTKTLVVMKREKLLTNASYDNVPESLIEKEIIHQDSIKGYLELFNKAINHQPQATAFIQIKSSKEGYHWNKVSYIRSDEKDPNKLVGVFQTIDEQKEYSTIHQFYKDYKKVISEDLITYLKINLENDTIVNHARTLKTKKTYKSFTEFVASTSFRIITPAEQKLYEKILDRKSLINNYNRGQNQIHQEFRYRNNNGEVRWIRFDVILEDENSVLHAYLIGRDITSKKKTELSLDVMSERDQVSYLYNDATTKLMINRTIEDLQTTSKKCAFMIISLENLQSLTTRLSDDDIHNIIRDIGQILFTKCASNDIIGQLDKDEFIVFVSNVEKEEDVIDKAKYILQAIDDFFEKTNNHITALIGLTTSHLFEQNYDSLYKKALAALVVAKERGSGLVTYESLLLNSNDSIADLIQEQDSTQELFESYSELLVASSNFSEAIIPIIKQLCLYYHAERICIVETDNRQKKANLTYEWCNIGIESLHDGLQNLAFNNFEYLVKFMQDNSGKVVSNLKQLKELSLSEYAFIASKSIYSFLEIPLQYNNQTIGFLMLHNLDNTKSPKLFIKVAKLITNQLVKEYLEKNQLYIEFYDELTGLKNRRSYINDTATLKESSLFSAGVLVLDVNGLRLINENFGNSYGDSVLIYMAEVLKNHFGYDACYRIDGDEFVVICQDIEYDAFIDHIECVKNEMNQQHYDVISLGYNWSHTNIDIASMIHFADEKRMISKLEYYQHAPEVSQNINAQRVEKVLSQIEEGLYIVYLQPKMDIKEDKLSGAEALVRLNSPSLGLLGPSKFIPTLESENVINYVDLYVFEEMCKFISTLDNKDFNVSLNFSRITLLDDNLIEKMITIANKYNVNRNQIEIEITESSSKGSVSSLINISNSIKEAGFKLSLDDFGTKYSNISVVSHLNIDTLKIDKNLVDDIYANNKAKKVVATLIDLCHNLNIMCVAEGAETIEQIEILKSLNCDIVQGYFYNKPIPQDLFIEKYLKKTSNE